MPEPRIYTSDIPFTESDLPGTSLGDVVKKACARNADLPAVSVVLPKGQSRTLTYRELDEYSDQVAAWLAVECGLGRGDVVALQCLNCLAFPVVAFGAMKAGVTLTNINPLYTPAEAQFQLQDSGAKMLFVIDVFGATVAETIADTKIEKVVRLSLTDLFPIYEQAFLNFLLKHVAKKIPSFSVDCEDTLATMLRKGRKAIEAGYDVEKRINEVTFDDFAFFQYTGGTTGRSKGAELTNGNVVCNITQGRLHNGITDEDAGETLLLVLPLYHVYALAVGCISGMNNGYHTVLVPVPRPLDAVRPAFEKFPVSLMPGINTLFLGLLQEPWFKGRNIASLRVVMSGGAPLAPETAVAFKKHTGLEIYEGYGLTESTCAAISNQIFDPPVRSAVGKPLPGTEVRFVDDEGNDVEPGKRGEVWIRGPQVMAGYLHNREATDETIDDGWLKTGDIGLIDEDDIIHIVDRKKDMVLVSGFNVFPTDIEAVLVTCPSYR